MRTMFDPEARGGFVYNRYANIVVEFPNPPQNIGVGLIAGDMYWIVLRPDLPSLQSRGYQYLVFPRMWPNATLYGFSLVEQIEPSQIYVYKRTPPPD